MQFDRHPDAVRIGIISVPGISEAAVVRHNEEWVVLTATLGTKRRLALSSSTTSLAEPERRLPQR